MYSVSEDSVRFSRLKEIQSIHFFEEFPDDARFVNVQEQLGEILTTIKKETEKNEFNYYRQQLNAKYKNLKFYMNGRRDPPLSFIRELEIITRKLNLNIKIEKLFNNFDVRFGHGGNAATARLPIIMTTELAYLVGAMRDGTLARSGKYEISYSQKNVEWLKTIKKLLIKTFQPSNEPMIRNDRVTLSNRPIFEYLHRIFDIPIGKKDQWETPIIIKNSSLEVQRYYIRGFYDADGLSWQLGFCQVNKEAIVFVKETLEKLGIKTGKLSVRKIKNKKPLYSFNTSRKSHHDFIRLIGSLNPSKRKLFFPT